MALYLPKTTKEGVPVNYWVIDDVKIDRVNKRVDATVNPYFSQEARLAGANPITFAAVKIRVEDIVYPSEKYGENSTDYTDYFSPSALEGQTLYQVVYNYIKTHDDRFKGATDI